MINEYGNAFFFAALILNGEFLLWCELEAAKFS